MGMTKTAARSQERAAGAIAEEEYLRFGQQQPPLLRMEAILAGMQIARSTPKRQLLMAGVRLDMARHPMSPPAEIKAHINSADYCLHQVASRDLAEVPTHDYRFTLQARLQRAYLPRTHRALVEGVGPTLEDEEQLVTQLLQIGAISFMGLEKTPENKNQAEAQKVIKGIQFELGMHLLHARTNLMAEDMQSYIWPSLPREDTPHTYDFSEKRGIDAARSTNRLFAGDAQKLQFKSVGEVQDYADDITTIVGRDDLGTRYSGEILDWAMREAFTTDEREEELAAERLDEFEERLFARLNDAGA